ncbi:MAG: hypothetical protein R3A51_00805 [Nannocystaceae bacterium]|nr:hypothetical protein [Myxococcales bacterium]
MTATVVGPGSPHLVWLRSGEAANERPPAEPGFRRHGAVVTYTTARGACYAVQDVQGRPCLIPWDGATHGELEDDDDPRRNILAEAADLLDAETGDGWFCFRFALFFRNASRTLLIFETERGYQAQAVAEVPAGALPVDFVPEGALAFVQRSSPALGGDHG